MERTSLPKIVLDSHSLANVEKALMKEWLVTNGLGGYASSTILGVNTRKYHGLLVAAFNPPVDRRVILTKLDEEIAIIGKTFQLGSNEVQQRIQPQGYRYISSFSLNPFPTYAYDLEGKLQLQKTILMPHGKNTVTVIYEATNKSADNALISVSPFVNFRHFHAVTEKHATCRVSPKVSNKTVRVQSPSQFLPSALTLSSTDGFYEDARGEWVESFFRVDASRGESCFDNSFKLGAFKFHVAPDKCVRFSIAAAAGKSEDEAQSLLSAIYSGPESVGGLLNAELKRRSRLLASFQKGHKNISIEDWLKWLVLATDAFIVKRDSTKAKSVIAGYHWFEDWGRDSLISLPGLTLVTGRFDDARQILLTFKRYCKEGVIPNRFPDWAGDKPVYNTVDATLWFVDAVLQYLKYTNDLRFVQDELWNTLESIVENHVKGTIFNIRTSDDGLLSHGSQLTWMDAAPNGIPVTPREGKAVEIQALWYNALKTMQLLATCFKETGKVQEYSALAEKAQRSFNAKFWNSARNCLFDVVKDDLHDASLRPNQILAVSLDFTMLDDAKAASVVDTVQKQLWGVYGLKTLSEHDSRYRGKYVGDWAQRDQAYHNGTVWPWLLGSFVKAFLKTKNYTVEWRRFALQNFLQPLFTEELFSAGLGSISEIFNGDPPHEPNGCIAQAWSVAEPLRVYVEDVLMNRPPFEQTILRG